MIRKNIYLSFKAHKMKQIFFPSIQFSLYGKHFLFIKTYMAQLIHLTFPISCLALAQALASRCPPSSLLRGAESWKCSCVLVGDSLFGSISVKNIHEMELNDIMEAFRFPWLFFVCVPIFLLMASPARGSHEIPVFRLQQFDLSGSPFGTFMYLFI